MALVLTRKIGDFTVLVMPDGTEVRKTVIEINGNKVREAWDAPLNVRILRGEVASRDALAAAGKGGGE